MVLKPYGQSSSNSLDVYNFISFLCLNNFSFVKQNKKVLKVFPNSQSGSHGDALYVNNKLINRISISKAKFKYFTLNNFLIDFLIKYTKVAFWKAKVKKFINY